MSHEQNMKDERYAYIFERFGETYLRRDFSTSKDTVCHTLKTEDLFLKSLFEQFSHHTPKQREWFYKLADRMRFLESPEGIEEKAKSDQAKEDIKTMAKFVSFGMYDKDTLKQLLSKANVYPYLTESDIQKVDRLKLKYRKQIVDAVMSRL